MSNSIVPISIEDELQDSYLAYAMSVIVSRAIPDVRDGLKPVHRRILYAMYESGCTWGKAFRKSARIVGEVMGKYHPHGDSAIYDALARMAQDFSLYLPLIDGQGNFGSIDGDPPAAMRYTEVRLAKSAHFMLGDIDENTVDFKPNYDGLESEPVVLPAVVPNILLNGSNGVAVGMATNIPPHNLGEIVDACNLYIDNNDVDLTELLSVMPGPDFPTGGVIVGRSGIHSAFATGRGSITIRGKTHFEDLEQNKSAIVIDELPYQVNKAKLIENIIHLARDKKIEGIADIKDESDKSGIRVVIELKRQVAPEIVLNHLLRFTALQVSFGINMMALNNLRPSLLSLKDAIVAFIDFRREVVTRRIEFQLQKAREKANVLIALYISLLNIDDVITLIKSSKDNNEAMSKLLEKEWIIDEKLLEVIELISGVEIRVKDYRLSDAQAKAILEMRLHRLTSLEKEKIYIELNTQLEKIKECISILSSETLLMSVIKEEINEVKTRFNIPRRTTIEEGEIDTDIEDLIEKEEMVVTVTEAGYIKRSKLSNYRSQHRGGKGKVGQSTTDEDFTSKVFVANTHTNMLFFSNKGQVYKTKVYKLPLGEPQSRGRALVNIFPLAEDEVINNVMTYPEDEEHELSIVFATAKGKVRRNALEDFAYIPSNGKIAIRLDEDDKLIAVEVCDPQYHILLSTQSGKSIRFAIDDIRLFKSRTSDGVRGIKLAIGDHVISMSILHDVAMAPEVREEYFRSCDSSLEADKRQYYQEQEQFILTVTENGFGKRSSAYEYRVTNRGGSGIVNIITSKRNGGVVASFPVEESDNVMLITDKGQLIRIAVNEIRVSGRSTQGVTLLKTKKGEKVVSVAKVTE